MKKMWVLVFSVFAMSSAFASADLSWDAIQKDGAYHALFPSVGFHYASVTVDALCRDGEVLRPMNSKHEHCIAWDRNSENPGCVATETVELARPVRYQATECVEWDRNSENPGCVAYATFEKELPLNYEVAVVDARQFASESGSVAPLFTKTYTIPSCR